MNTRVSTKQFARMDTSDKEGVCIFCSKKIPAGDGFLRIGTSEEDQLGKVVHGELFACKDCLKTPKVSRLRKMKNGQEFKLADYLTSGTPEIQDEHGEPTQGNPESAEGKVVRQAELEEAPDEPKKPKKPVRPTVSYADCLRESVAKSMKRSEGSQPEMLKAPGSAGDKGTMSTETAEMVFEAMKIPDEATVKVPEAAFARAEALVADMVRASNNMNRMLLEQDKQAEKFVRAASILISMTEENRGKAIKEAKEILGAADGLRDSAAGLKEAAEGLPTGYYEEEEEPEPTWKTAARMGTICMLALFCGWAIHSAAPGAEVILNSVGLHVSNLGSLAIFGCAGLGLLVACCCMAVEGVKAVTKHLKEQVKPEEETGSERK